MFTRIAVAIRVYYVRLFGARSSSAEPDVQMNKLNMRGRLATGRRLGAALPKIPRRPGSRPLASTLTNSHIHESRSDVRPSPPPPLPTIARKLNHSYTAGEFAELERMKQQQKKKQTKQLDGATTTTTPSRRLPSGCWTQLRGDTPTRSTRSGGDTCPHSRSPRECL